MLKPTGKGTLMALWKLSPIDLTDPSWQSSSHRGPAIVRAKNEDQARAIAARSFDLPVGFRPGQGVHAPPWRRASLVRIEAIDDPRFTPDGPDEVLDPSF